MKNLIVKTLIVFATVFAFTAVVTDARADGSMVTKAPPAAAATNTPATCDSFWNFISTSCPLTWYGITVYGSIDTGVTWQSHTAGFNRLSSFGVNYLIQKNSSRSLWLPGANGLSQSNIGIKGVEPIWDSGWNFIFNLQADFDPYSLRLINGPHSVFQEVGTPLNRQTAIADSSRQGQIYNGIGYAGVSSPTWGTLTVFRQYALTNDAIATYDPMGGSYAFSVLGFSGTTCGAGGTLSLDAIGSFVKDAVSIGLSGNPVVNGVPVPPFLPQVLTATISDDTGVMLLGKYVNGPLKLYAGYEWIQFAPPSGTPVPFTDISGDFVSTLNTTAFNFHDKVLQVFWTGVGYAVTKNVTVVGAFYHYDQNSFGGGASSGCGTNAFSTCSGTQDAVSAMVDWQFAAKFDAYGGLMWSQVDGGLANGFLRRNNIDPTVGVRFRF